jgi:hypothetical protein
VALSGTFGGAVGALLAWYGILVTAAGRRSIRWNGSGRRGFLAAAPRG